jgi:hypothetical protein
MMMMMMMMMMLSLGMVGMLQKQDEQKPTTYFECIERNPP